MLLLKLLIAELISKRKILIEFSISH